MHFSRYFDYKVLKLNERLSFQVTGKTFFGFYVFLVLFLYLTNRKNFFK